MTFFNPVTGTDYRIYPSYIYIFTLSDADIAWEYLRRNKNYQADFFMEQEEWGSRKRLENELIASELDLEAVGAGLSMVDKENLENGKDYSEWGLLSLENPSLRADEASIYWDPKLLASAIEYKKTKQLGQRSKKRSLNTLKNKNIFFRPDGCVTSIKHDGDDIVLYGNDSPITGEDETLEFIEKGPDPKAKRNIRRANRIFRDSPKPKKSNIMANRNKHIHNLIAFDGISVGADPRDIAISLFGQNKIDDEWSNPDKGLKNKTKRRIDVGKKYINGKYKKLLSTTTD